MRKEKNPEHPGHPEQPTIAGHSGELLKLVSVKPGSQHSAAEQSHPVVVLPSGRLLRLPHSGLTLWGLMGDQYRCFCSEMDWMEPQRICAMGM